MSREIVAYAEKESWSCDGPGVLRTEWRVRTIASYTEGELDRYWGSSWRTAASGHKSASHVLEQRYIRCGVDEGWKPHDAYASRADALEDVNSDAVSLDSKLDEIRARWQAANEASKAAEEEKRQAEYRAERARASEKTFQQMQQSPRGKALADQWNGFVAAHANAADKARLEADSEFMSRYRAMLDATQISVKTKALKELFRYVKSQELGGLPSRSTDMGKTQYEVIVGNIGTVYRGTNHLEAARDYAEYVKMSKSGDGRAGGESVTLMKNGEPEREHFGTQDDDELSGFKSSHSAFSQVRGGVYADASLRLSDLKRQLKDCLRRGDATGCARLRKQISNEKKFVTPCAGTRDQLAFLSRELKGCERLHGKRSGECSSLRSDVATMKRVVTKACPRK